MDAGFGIMVHYLKPVIVPEGGAKEWNDAVNRFDVEKFASQAKDVPMAEKIMKGGGVLCLEVVADATGEILPQQLEQIKEVGKYLRP